MQNTSALKAVALDLIKEYSNEISGLAQNLDPTVWAKESFRIAQNTTYPPMFSSNEITPEYQATTIKACRKRVTLAGYRMANLIKSIY